MEIDYNKLMLAFLSALCLIFGVVAVIVVICGVLVTLFEHFVISMIAIAVVLSITIYIYMKTE